MIDSQHKGDKHIGKLANEMENWNTALLPGELELSSADINQIEKKHPTDSKLQA